MLIKTKQKSAVCWHSILRMKNFLLQEPHFFSVDLFGSWVCQNPPFCWASRSVWCLVSSEKGWKKCVFSPWEIRYFNISAATGCSSVWPICSQMFSALGLWAEHAMTGFEGTSPMARCCRLCLLDTDWCLYLFSLLLWYHCNLQWDSKPNLSLLKEIEN